VQTGEEGTKSCIASGSCPASAGLTRSYLNANRGSPEGTKYFQLRVKPPATLNVNRESPEGMTSEIYYFLLHFQYIF